MTPRWRVATPSSLSGLGRPARGQEVRQDSITPENRPILTLPTTRGFNMPKEIPVKDWPTFTIRLHPLLVAFLEGRGRMSGRSVESEASCVVGEAMERAEIPPAPTNTAFQCRETPMAEKAECRDCGDLIRHNARLWAERHVQLTGHNVHVSLYIDMVDDGWLEKLTPERRAELDAVRDGDVGRALAQQLLAGTKH